ncbi:MAG TPA: methyltransferase domain-containing protein [Hyphomicrobium sp.]|nr:methyltransferase domain-containing protein [Hyphomicrobium sp.]
MSELEFERRFFSGRELYGDDFTPDEIAAWYDDERSGYYKLATEFYDIATADEYDYGYEALNKLHAFEWLSKRNYDVCLALGCAKGDDVAPLAPNVGRFVGLEPAQEWWSDSIGGKPAVFMSPSATGEIPLPSRSVDLAVALGVLHHIPNVGRVVGEVSRVLRPGGFFVLREPINSMGDWRKPRPGLTKHERGLPLQWLRRNLIGHDFKIRRARVCMINAAAILFSRPGGAHVYNDRAFCVADWIASEALRWNVSYYRSNALKKLAPSSAFIIAERVSPSDRLAP